MQVDMMMDPSLSNSTPMDLLNARDRLRLGQEERIYIARLQHRRKRDQERRPEQAEVRKAGLDSYTCAEQQNSPRLSRPGSYSTPATDCQCTHEHRAAEGYRQTRLERLRERNVN